MDLGELCLAIIWATNLCLYGQDHACIGVVQPALIDDRTGLPDVSLVKYLIYIEVGLCLLCSKLCPLCFLAFPKYLAYYAHFYASQI